MRPRGLILRRLRSDRGFALIDVMVGIVIVALTLGGIATVSAAVANAVAGQITRADRAAYVTSKANELATNPSAVLTTVVASTPTIGRSTVQLVQVRVNRSSTQDVIRVAAPVGDTYDCSNAVTDAVTTTDTQRCVVAEVSVDTVSRGTSFTPYPVTIAQSGIDGSTPAAAAAGTLAAFTAPADVTPTVKWILGVKPGSGAARVTITQGATVLAVQSFEATAPDTYLSGTFAAAAGQTYTISWDGAAGTAHNFLIYK